MGGLEENRVRSAFAEGYFTDPEIKSNGKPAFERPKMRQYNELKEEPMTSQQQEKKKKES